MPIYKFEHVIPLSRSQKTGLAQSITDWHATTFKAPRFIVNVRFVDVSQGVLADSYIGGAQRQTNRLFVSLRSGAGRTESQLQGMSDKLESLWDLAVGKSRSNQLRGVFIMGHLDSAKEAGFHLPLVCLDLYREFKCARYLTAYHSLVDSSNGSRIIRTSFGDWRRRATLMRHKLLRKSRLGKNSRSNLVSLALFTLCEAPSMSTRQFSFAMPPRLDPGPLCM